MKKAKLVKELQRTDSERQKLLRQYESGDETVCWDLARKDTSCKALREVLSAKQPEAQTM